MNIYIVFIFLYALVGVVPYFGAVDKTMPQNLYLNVLNIIVFSFFFFNKKKTIY